MDMLRKATTLLVSLAGLTWAQSELAFSRVASGDPAPSGRIDGPLAYDAAGRLLLLFGGQDNASRNDLWAFSLETQRWTELNPAGNRPPARFGHTTIFDPVRRRLVVFGGQAGGFFSDVWAYDVAGNAWQQLAPDNAGPSRRYGHSAIYDSARDRMVISHGFTDAGRFDDTWAFDLASGRWQNLSPSGTRPLRRCLHHAVYDARNQQMLLFGGCASGNGPCPLDDLWAFDLTRNQWTQRSSTPRPAARQWYAMAFDSRRQRLVLFGGSGGRGSLNDTWEYDPAADAWAQLSPRGETPAARSRHEAAFVSETGATFFFGGRTDVGLTNELLALEPPAAGRPQFTAGSVINAFGGQTGAVAPGEIVSIFGSRLGPAAGVAGAFDPATERLPTRLGGVSVRFNLTAAPIYFARADQLNVQVPYELAGLSETTLTVNFDGGAASARLPVVAVRPGLYPRVFNQDGSVNSPENPAAPGSVVVLFGTGQGVTDPPSPTGAFPRDGFPVPAAPAAVRIGGREAELLFRGQAPGTAGVIQLNVRIPDGASGAALPVVWSVGEAGSQAGVTVAVR
jgi:uncharacterized protein (TIGR03437 family)